MDAEKARELVSDVTVSGDFGSNCCGSSMYELGDNYICTNCKEYCEAVSDEKSDDRIFSNEQLAHIAAQEKKCADAGCEDTHKCA